ncbi:hypothetical protein CAT7_04984 [Carnobacterium sp. AT7]|uniref:DUF1642 domain-containing protein n=1 Tax=Carnobacterium sp. AT7 TaxID=333990 RepID=UPI00015F1981|nr:DUF1642 domain-containing protein [Carnobacterium sp. AT7]EDP68593.1 hypothetical protein CAT7_04984 [Carnobacterium sp. AT7]
MNKEELRVELIRLRSLEGNYNDYPVDSRKRLSAVGKFEGINEALKIVEKLDEPEITEEQALNKLAESYPFSADGINAILQAQLAGYIPVSTVTFFKGNELAFSEDTFWEYMNDQYRLDKEELFGKLKENNYLKKHSIVELPVIPEVVADFIEKEKNKSIPPILYGAYLGARKIPDVFKWVWKNDKNHNAFAIAYIIGNYEIKKEPIKTHQVLVKFFDNEEYKTELTEEVARELIEFLEANKK